MWTLLCTKSDSGSELTWNRCKEGRNVYYAYQRSSTKIEAIQDDGIYN